MAATPVQQIQVDAIGLQPPQAALAGGRNAGARGILRQHLADDEQLVPLPCAGLGDDLLGTPAGVHLGGVDQGHAEVDPKTQRIDLTPRLAVLLAHVPRALAKRGDCLPTRK